MVTVITTFGEKNKDFLIFPHKKIYPSEITNMLTTLSNCVFVLQYFEVTFFIFFLQIPGPYYTCGLCLYYTSMYSI